MRRVFRVMMMMLLVVAGQAHAQSGDTSALAEHLFNQARELVKANQWAEACPKFEASLRYDPVLGTRLNLATCYEHIGKLASAWGLYRESIELAKKAGNAKRRDYAYKQAAAIEPRLPKLAISAPAKPPAGFVVMRDGARIDAGALGVTLYLDSGAHEITASAPGFEAFTQTITLVEGKTESLVIPDLKAAPVPVIESPNPPIQGPAATPEPVVAPSPGRMKVVTIEPVVAPSSTRKYVAIGVGAAGVAAVGVGFLFGAKSSSAFSDAKTLCGASLVCDPADYGKGKKLMRDAHADAMISTVLVAAGGAAIVASAIVFLTAPHAREHATARLTLVTHDRGAGLTITGRF
jgi:hypothetical protein